MTMLKMTLNLNAVDVTALVEALEKIKAEISLGVTISSGYCDEFSYDFEVDPTEDYEDDRQPDEAQEWYDFDPDC